MINRNQLALFHAVAEEGGFGRAARRLHISQPAVSIQISQLEDVLGVRLFDRIGRTIRLTPAGETLAAYARRIAALEGEADHAMRQLATVQGGRLRIGASSTIGAYLLPQLMSDFHRQWPAIALEMTLGNTTVIQQQLVDGVIDLGLVEGKHLNPVLTIQTFRDDQLVPIAAWDHPLTKLRSPTLKQFLKYPLILRETGSGTRQTILDFLSARGLANFETQSFGSNEAVKGAVAAGLGVSFVSSLTIPGDVMLKRLEVLGLKDAKVIRRPFYVIQIPGKTPNPAAAAFMSIVRKR